MVPAQLDLDPTVKGDRVRGWSDGNRTAHNARAMGRPGRAPSGLSQVRWFEPGSGSTQGIVKPV